MLEFKKTEDENISLFFHPKHSMKRRIISLSMLSFLLIFVLIISPENIQNFNLKGAFFILTASLLAIFFIKTFIGIEKDGIIILLRDVMVFFKSSDSKFFSFTRIADPYIKKEGSNKNLVFFDLNQSEWMKIPVNVSESKRLLKEIEKKRSNIQNNEIYIDEDGFQLKESDARRALIIHEYTLSLLIFLFAIGTNLYMFLSPLGKSIEEKIFVIFMLLNLPFVCIFGSKIGLFLASIIPAVNEKNQRIASVFKWFLLSIIFISFIFLPFEIF